MEKNLDRAWLKELRESMGLSQAMVAKRANMSTSNYNMIETGLRRGSVEALSEIANVLGISLDRFRSSSSN